MCGIFGILNNDNKKELITNSFLKGKGRGPETSSLNFYETSRKENEIVLGFHRLAINGYLNENSEQPFDKRDCVLICNGEIYNWKELLKLQKNHEEIPYGSSDCEIILHLYKNYGIEYTYQVLDGVFAFILFDKMKQEVYVARDMYGVRPLFMGMESKNLGEFQYFFGSEIKMIYDLKKDENSMYVDQVKPGYVYKFDVRTMIFQEKSMKTNPFINNTLYNETTILSTIRDTLIGAVKKRVDNTDRPIACLLSGGLDSSLITALVVSIMGGPNVKTFSIGMKGSEDLKYAKLAADYLKTNHTTIILEERDFLEAIEKVIYSIESYDTTTVRASVGNWLVSKYIKENSDCKVVFNGDGSDEVTGGYMYFHCAPDSLSFDKECKRLIDNIHYYDVLRSDRSISCHGLEARTPFLDRNFVQTYLSIPSKFRCHNIENQCEKYLLRKAFDVLNILPNSVLWRTKEAFSDGVSKSSKSWYEVIQDYVKEKIYNVKNEKVYIQQKCNYYNWVKNKPTTLEQLYYREVFHKYYRNTDNVIPEFWMPRFVEANDASARTLQIYKKQMQEDEEKNYLV
uniref:asparagine synthase (glutamine-hydrolyzing) n=1 Tax=viral metagenome TaxID=1070528 RepID=A0A6C0CNW3_9ZZZZ